MNVASIARRAWHTARYHRTLWFFGFFSAAAGSVSVAVDASETLHFAVSLLALALSLAALVLHVISDAALVAGVVRTRDGGSPDVRWGLHHGRRFFWRVLGLKAIRIVATCGVLLVAVGPGLALFISSGAKAPAIGVSILLGLVAIPIGLTIHFVYQWALRSMVLEDGSVRESIARGNQFLRGRVRDSLWLLVASQLGRMAIGTVAVLVLVPVALGAWAAFGVVPAVVTGAVFAVPIAILTNALVGTYQSSLWTHVWVNERLEA